MRKSEKTPLSYNQFWNLFSLLVIILSLSHCSTRSAFSPSVKNIHLHNYKMIILFSGKCLKNLILDYIGTLPVIV